MAAVRTSTELHRSLSKRAVHLRIYPRPQSFAENRMVFQLIKTFGEIEMYKSLRYDRIPVPNSALAIFREASSAAALIQKSPLRFTMYPDDDTTTHEQEDTREAESSSDRELEQLAAPNTEYEQHEQTYNPFSTSSQGGAWGLSPQSRGLSTSSRHGAARSMSQPRQPQQPQEQHYEIQISMSRANHRDQINVNPYHGPFAIDTKSAIQQDLVKRVPMPGLSDLNLHKPDKPWRVLAWQRAREEKTYESPRAMYERGLNSQTREKDTED